MYWKLYNCHLCFSHCSHNDWDACGKACNLLSKAFFRFSMSHQCHFVPSHLCHLICVISSVIAVSVKTCSVLGKPRVETTASCPSNSSSRLCNGSHFDRHESNFVWVAWFLSSDLMWWPEQRRRPIWQLWDSSVEPPSQDSLPGTA